MLLLKPSLVVCLYPLTIYQGITNREFVSSRSARLSLFTRRFDVRVSRVCFSYWTYSGLMETDLISRVDISIA